MTEESKKDEFITKEDLASILEAKGRALTAVHAANNAASEAKIAELEYRVLVQNTFIKYEMKATDRIEDANGRIVRPSKEELAKLRAQQEAAQAAQQGASVTEPAPANGAEPAPPVVPAAPPAPVIEEAPRA